MSQLNQSHLSSTSPSSEVQPSISDAELQLGIALFTELSTDSRRVIVRLMQSMLGRPRTPSTPALPPPPAPAPFNPSLGMIALSLIVALLLLIIVFWLSKSIGLWPPL